MRVVYSRGQPPYLPHAEHSKVITRSIQEHATHTPEIQPLVDFRTASTLGQTRRKCSRSIDPLEPPSDVDPLPSDSSS